MVSTVIQLAGFGLLTAAGFQLSPFAGLVVGGFSLLAVGHVDGAIRLPKVRLPKLRRKVK